MPDDEEGEDGAPELRESYARYVDAHRAKPPHASGGLPAPTASRIEAHSAEKHNRRIAAETERAARRHVEHPERIDARLAELDREWDVERMLEANAAAIALAGTLLDAFVDRRFLIVPRLVAGFLLQHALQGWCPPVPLFRRKGVRTAREIEWERRRGAARCPRLNGPASGRGHQVCRSLHRPFSAWHACRES